MSTQKVIVDLAKSVEGSSTTAIVAGFSFASAVAWMDFVRFAIDQMVNVKKNGGNYLFITALATTVVASLVMLVARLFRKNIKQPQVMYAVTA